MRTEGGGMEALEGEIEVPGARLRYRLAGATKGPVLVFENGWGASYEMWAWVERELAPYAQLLFYNRAGIGGSELLGPQTVEGLSAQFIALPKALGLEGPIVAIGQSYGGLMCALHAAQQPQALLTVIEIDPTPEQAIAEIDEGLNLLPSMISAVKFLLKLGLPNFIFGAAGKMLPPAQGKAILSTSLSNPASLDAGLAEFALLPGIRAAIESGRPQGFKRLVIGAGTAAIKNGFITRLLVSNKRATGTYERSRLFQVERGHQDAGCEVMTLPYDHGGLVFEPAGAKETSIAIKSFLGRVSGS